MNWQWLFILQLLCVEISLAANEDAVSDSPEQTLQFVDKVKRKFDEGRTSATDKIILVIGNTGSGKSTLVHYVAGDNSQMESVKKKRGFMIIDYLDKDINKTTSKTESRTLVPEMIAENGNVWYDCPGFGDTRNDTVEIATTFLFKSVIERAKFIKFVLVINYDSVNDEISNRYDFDKLLSHTTQLVKNVKQFNKSFSMVVTRVGNFYIDDGNQIPVTVEDVRETTAEFLLEHREFLKTKQSSASKIELIDAILERSVDGRYPRISPFWKPHTVGRFDQIEYLVTGRKTIRQSILSDSSYAVADQNSFGYPLSGEAQLKVRTLIHHTGSDIFKTLQTTGQDFLNKVRDHIDATRNLKNRYELIQLASPYMKVIRDKREMPLDEAKTILRNLIRVYDLTTIEFEQNFAKIKRYQEILDTFFLIARNDVQNKNYLPPLMDAHDFFAKYETNTQNDILNETRRIMSVASKLLTNVTVRLTNELKDNIDLAFDYKTKLDLINLGKTLIASTKKDDQTPIELVIQKIQSLIENFDLTSVDVKDTEQMQDYEMNIHTLKALVMIFEPGNELISKNITYSTHLEIIKDFFKVNEDKIMKLIKTEAQIYIERITSSLLSADAELNKFLQKQLSMTSGYRNRLELIERANDVAQNNVTTLQQRASQLIMLSQTYNATAVDVNELANIETFEKNVNALNLLQPDETKTELRTVELLTKSTNAINYLMHENDWYAFLDQVYNTLSNYQVQNNTQAYIRTTLSKWKNANNNNVNVTEASFKDFTQAVKINFKLPLNGGSRLNELDDILNAMLNSPIKYECNEKSNSMIIRGNFLITSHINLEKCSLKARQKITIYVTDTFFIDSNLKLRENPETQLHIFAHTWHVQNYGTIKYSFNLNGIDGENQEPPISKGVAGNPGQSGTNAGHFFGVANRLIDGESLTVLLNGGNGGNGQDGSVNDDVIVTHNGRTYALSISAFSDSDYAKTCALEELRKATGAYKGEIRQIKPTINKGRHGQQHHMWCEVKLFKAGCCGKTGKGGPPGLGAHSGYFTFINTGSNTKQQPTHSQTDGKNGTQGIDSKVCKTRGLLLEANVVYQKYLAHTSLWVNSFSPGNDKSLEVKDCPDIIVSPTGTAKSVPKPKKLNMLPDIIAYKSFLIENFSNFAYANVAQKSYDSIASNAVISNKYTLSSFAMEANALEKQFYEVSKYVDLLPLYDALIDRIKNFSITHAEELKDQDREVLALVYSTLFSRTAGIRDGHQSDLIINIEEFLGASKKRIKNLDKIDRIKRIRDEKSEYRNETIAKIAEANALIESDVTPEFGKIFQSIDAGIQAAITETIKLQKDLGDNIAEKEALKFRVQQNAGLRKVVGIGKFLSSCLTMCGSFGVNVGPAPDILKTGIETLEELAKDPEFKNSEVPTAIQNVWNEMKKKENETKAAINDILSKLRDSIASLNIDHTQFDKMLIDFKKNMSQIASQDPSKMLDSSELFVLSNQFLEETQKLLVNKPNNLRQKRQADNEIPKIDPINEITLFVNKHQMNRPNQNDDEIEVITVDYIDYDDNGRVITVLPPTTTTTTTTTVATTTDSTTTQATKKDDDDDEKELKEKVKKYFEGAKNGLKVLKSGKDLWDLFAKDDEGLTAITKAIEHDKNLLKAAVQLEVQIYTELWPTIYTLHSTISNATENMGGKSSVSLDVMQYKIRATLRNVQEKFAKKLDGLESPKEITNCLARLDEAMELMIHIYDRIQGYNEQLRFAGHLAKLQEANFGKLGDADENIIGMKYHFQANIILTQYYRAIDAFKQAVFPYADYYLGTYVLPPSLNTTDSSVVISQAIDKVDSLITNIKELKKTVINKNDMLIHTTKFNDVPGSPGPFYTWNDEVTRSQIQELFNGSKIYLFADARQSKLENAVKFNKIQLKILSHDKDENQRLQNALKQFKVAMIHMGESNYRCNRDFYSISSRPLNVSYTFNEENGIAIDANDAYRKLVDAPPVLSPYTLWEIQLVRGPLHILKAFTQVSIGLYGEGQYLDEKAEVCNNNLAKYYPPQLD